MYVVIDTVNEPDRLNGLPSPKSLLRPVALRRLILRTNQIRVKIDRLTRHAVEHHHTMVVDNEHAADRIFRTDDRRSVSCVANTTCLS